MNERLAGNRFLRGLVCPGGVRMDVPADVASAIEPALARAEGALAALVRRIDTNPTVVDRLAETGHFPRQAAVDLAATGIAARASGVARDARRDHPHAAFAGLGAQRPLAFAIVTADEGGVHARLHVRASEAKESIRLVRTLVARLERGPVAAAVPERLPPGRIGLAAIESPRGASVHWLRADAQGLIDRYPQRSASYANWPAVAFAAHNAIVPEFRALLRLYGSVREALCPGKL